MVITRETVSKAVAENGVRFQAHDEGWTGALGWWAERLGWKNWRERYWMTIGTTIYHPAKVQDPLGNHVIVLHELVHVRQQREVGPKWWLFRYCTSWRFRWEQEREAYLVDIQAGRLLVSEAINLLREYGIDLPYPQMEAWFNRHTNAGDKP